MLVDVVAMHVVKVAIVQIVDVSGVLHGRMSAARPVNVRMVGMCGVFAHERGLGSNHDEMADYTTPGRERGSWSVKS
jgi:hypothetical protein